MNKLFYFLFSYIDICNKFWMEVNSLSQQEFSLIYKHQVWMEVNG